MVNCRNCQIGSAKCLLYLERLPKGRHARCYSAKEIIITEGSIGNSMCIVLEGTVDILLYSEDGREIIINSLETGNFFGEMSLLEDLPRSAHVIGRTQCRILEISRQEYLEMVSQEPELALYMLAELSSRLRYSDEKIRFLSLSSANERIKWFIERLWVNARIANKRPSLPSHSRIAMELGLTRETVSRIINDLRRKNWFADLGWQGNGRD